MVHTKYMEITTTTINRNPRRRAAVNALAIVGFIALLALGIALAVYSARNLPDLASRFGGAAVSLSSVFRDNDEEPSLDVVTATSTLSFEDEVIVATTTTPEETPARAVAGGRTTYTTVTTVVPPPAPFGDPDLSVRITETGYLRRGTETDSFVASNTIPDGKNGAIKFTVTNVGTNNSGVWKFEAEVPTTPARDFTSPTQKSLGPSDRIDFTLGFTKPREGENRKITITIDPKDSIDESNEGNNEASRTVDIDN